MNTRITDFVLISANIGSTFDFPDRMFSSWIDNVIQKINEYEPLFIAIHCQEVGGKNYEESMQHVDKFIKLLLKNPSLNCYDKARIYLDEDFTVEEKFTALGNLYFIHESVPKVEQWDFIANEYILVRSREIFSANIEHIPHKFKEKFPLEFFPEKKWSRKGFIHTRWKIWDLVLDFVNIHLFHDICNLAPIIKDPSTYSACRTTALEYTLKKVTKNYSENIPLFIFGDFNFRLSTPKLIKQIVEPGARIENVYKKSDNKSDEIRKIIYRKQGSANKTILNENLQNGLEDKLLEVARKKFDMPDFNEQFFEKPELFRKFDEEPLIFFKYLYEFSINFPPSYPFSENENEFEMYMTTRCPSWCDRIFLNINAKNLIQINNENSIKYEMIGLNSCVGDHKPICLSFQLTQSANNHDIDVEISQPHNFVNSTNNSYDNNNLISIDNVISEHKYSEDSGTCLNPNCRPHNSPISNDVNRRGRHSVVDAINGLRASEDIDKPNEMWNIFDNGRFDKEIELDIKFRLSHRPYVDMSNSVGEQNSNQNNSRSAQSLFIQAARQITAAESVISAFRQSINRKRKISDSSTDSDPDEDGNQNSGSADVNVETYEISSRVIINDNNNISPVVDVPNLNENKKNFNEKNSCCTIS